MSKFYRKWNSWILDEEEIKNEIEAMGLDYKKFSSKEINEIAETVKEWLAHSESEDWQEWIKESIKQTITDLSSKKKDKDQEEFDALDKRARGKYLDCYDYREVIYMLSEDDQKRYHELAKILGHDNDSCEECEKLDAEYQKRNEVLEANES